MKIALHDVDKTKYPNLALMKISAWHKKEGDKITWYDPLLSHQYDAVYSSKVFTFTKTEKLFGKHIIRGGTGIDIHARLRNIIEHGCPDYDLYNLDYSLGFLTRGCIRQCSFCIVPKKEGYIKPHQDIEQFLRHDKAVLMDNNVLACDYGIEQIEKIIKLGIKVDFNQGLDARLIDNSMAKLLSKVKWLSPIRLACDSQKQMDPTQKAVTLLRWHNATPRRYFIYVLIKDPKEALERIKFLKGLDLDCHAQPFIDFENSRPPTRDQKNLARWVNHKAIFKSVPWGEYEPCLSPARGKSACYATG
ncbi:MAG: radical SAM protein [PVC group bacterium]|nr:radical SAM protein [PVC group bacterium]